MTNSEREREFTFAEKWHNGRLWPDKDLIKLHKSGLLVMVADGLSE